MNHEFKVHAVIVSFSNHPPILAKTVKYDLKCDFFYFVQFFSYIIMVISKRLIFHTTCHVLLEAFEVKKKIIIISMDISLMRLSRSKC